MVLEKELGCTLINKLRAILLMEADFNFSNKILYGTRMVDNVRRFGLMPEDTLTAKKNRMADDRTLAKVLFFDVVRQFKLPAGLSSVDAVNCYDSAVHVILALTFRAFGVPKGAVQAILQTIEKIKYFLRTAYLR